jgi:dTDP-4-dehydrorhamnose 3,5-epimerase
MGVGRRIDIEPDHVAQLVDDHEGTKLVSGTRGSVFDIAVDLRPGSPSRGRWVSVELSAHNGSALYIPAGFAHGFQTMTDDAEVRYHISERYHPKRRGGCAGMTRISRSSGRRAASV